MCLVTSLAKRSITSEIDKEEGKQLYVLYEHACGYGLFKISEFEEIGEMIPEVSAAIADLARFNSIVKLVAFYAFKSSKAALENINAISEGIIHPDLRTFILSNFPMKKSILGCGHRTLAETIQGEMEIPCLHTGAVSEITRGIRVHFPKIVPGMSRIHENKGQVGLGHSYSRAKIKFNINRADNMIIQSINLLDQMDKDINTFVMRLREWYSYHFPELVKLVPDNHLYVRCVVAIKSRADVTEEIEETLEEILMDSTLARAVHDACKSSMGMDITPLDLLNIEQFSNHIIRLIDRRKRFLTYLQSKMSTVAPNLCELIGESVAARLISQAGSLTNLAKFPASTVQILGAEKALFRALKTRGNTPKYGLIFHSTFIGRAAKENKGKISRFLASKCSLASRIDCFSDVPTCVFGEHLKRQVENRLKSLDTGEAGPTNAEVMAEAVAEAQVAIEEVLRQEKKKKKKAKKAKRKKMKKEEEEEEDEDVVVDLKKPPTKSPLSEEEVEEKPKKKKKKSLPVEVEEEEVEEEPKKKKKKKKSLPVEVEEAEEEQEEVEEEPKKKKKKKSLPVEMEVEEMEEEPKKKKKKKSLPVEMEVEEMEEEPKKKKKKSLAEEEEKTPQKKKRKSEGATMEVVEVVPLENGGSQKKKKKKRKSEPNS